MYSFSLFREIHSSHCAVLFDPRGEIAVHSEKYGYAGSLDALGTLPSGEIVVYDFKTSKAVYPSMALQIAAYAKALEECDPGIGKVGGGVVVKLGREPGSIEEYVIADLDEAFVSFRAALHLWRTLQPGATPMFKEPGA